MITSNGFNFLKTFLQYNDATNDRTVNLIDTTNTSGSFNVIKTSSGLLGWAPAAANDAPNAMYIGGFYYITNGTNVYHGTSSASGRFGLRVGDGNSTPTLNDIDLSGSQITTFTATTAVSLAINNGTIEMTATYNITNTGADAFTIKEYGMFIRNSHDKYAMIDRGIVETPITIEPGNTSVLTIKFRMF